jgi:hypothetical protein
LPSSLEVLLASAACAMLRSIGATEARAAAIATASLLYFIITIPPDN